LKKGKMELALNSLFIPDHTFPNPFFIFWGDKDRHGEKRKRRARMGSGSLISPVLTSVLGKQ
jgi:hypothetical protein